jgi:hypothetical protein
LHNSLQNRQQIKQKVPQLPTLGLYHQSRVRSLPLPYLVPRPRCLMRPSPKPPAPPCAVASVAPSAPPPITYAKAIASVPKLKYHARPSLIIHLCQTSLIKPLQEVAQSKALLLVDMCNQVLSSKAYHTNIQVSAAKWSPIGNLVMLAGPKTSLTQL